MMRIVSFLLLVFAAAATMAFSQEVNVESYVSRVESGDGDDVRAELPELLKKDPANPGLFYLQALLTTDGAEAARMYQDIVDKYPTSEWADDALWKIHKFYTAIGLQRTADLKLQQLRTNYPNSKYIMGKAEPVAVAGKQIEPKPNPEPPVRNEEEKKVETPAAPHVTPSEEKKPEERPKEVVANPTNTPPTETKPAEPPSAPKEPEKSTALKYTLQVGVYSTYANAVRQKQFFEYQKQSAEIVRKAKGSKDLFVVYVGSFATAADAEKVGNDFKHAFSIDFVVATR